MVSRMSYLYRIVVLFLLVTLSACGGGGGGSPTPTPSPPVSTPPAVPTPVPEAKITTISLRSDAGDWLGLGKNMVYNKTNAKIEITAQKNQLVVRVDGDESWTGVFQTGGTEQTQLKVGMVADAARYIDKQDWSKNGLTWFGEGRSCSSATGWFAIDSVAYSNGALSQISLRFERHCNGAAAALRGEVKYYAEDASKPPPPAMPVPSTLWRPPADLANGTGSYAYFESDEGDFVGLGKTYRYDDRSARISVSGSHINLVISVSGNEQWSAELRGMEMQQKLEPGYYPGITGSRFHNPVKGGLSWTGEGRGCRESTGWFAIDSVVTDGYDVVGFDLRFEQHCEGRAAALRGVIHYVKPDVTKLPPVAGNTPVGSWRAPSAALPASGNYLYVQSDPGEALGKGLIDLQTSAVARIAASARDNTLSFETQGVHSWRGEFIARAGQKQFEPGSYPAMAGYPAAVSPFGAFTVYGDSHSAHDPRGWVVIDHIRYVDGVLVELDLRFEQLGANRIGNDYGLLHGQLRWRAGQPDTYAGPAWPPPATFWRPAAGMTPSSGNYVYLESDRSDFIGYQGAYLYTPLDSMMTLSGEANKMSLDLRGDELWQGEFTAIANLKQIEPGYYRGLRNSAAFNPARGAFHWGGDGRGCNDATSGVVVDKVSYVGGKLAELHMRFEQHCENEPGALRGEIRWSASDLRKPAGPASIPGNLWRAPSGVLPASGNYLYAASEPGASVGHGKAELYTTKDATIYGYTSTSMFPEAYFGMRTQTPTYGGWNIDMQAMVGYKQFQVGFYNYAMRFPFHNRAFGALSASAHGAGCNTSTGWYAIDKVTYVGDTLAAIHARFEQYCDADAVPARGELNWEASPAELLAARVKPQPARMQTGAGALTEGPVRGDRRR